MFSELTDDDVQRLAEQCLVASNLCVAASGKTLDQSLADLVSLQRVLDAGLVDASMTYELQCLGVAFGCVLARAIADLDWAIVDDEYGRDPTLRLGHSSVQINCLTMISKRVESESTVDMHALFDRVTEHLNELRAQLPVN
jgi:hypothetical protein